MSESSHDLIVVGAGLSGLSCALHAARAGLRPLVLDAADRPGGRVATDEVEGFLLDRGFQVLLDSYPEVRALELDRRLSLRPYEPGALVAAGGGRLRRMADPWRRPLQALGSFFTDCGTWSDKLAIAAWHSRALHEDPQAFAARPEVTTRERLREIGLGGGLVDAFFRPFFGGIFLDLELTTSSRMLDFLFPLFARGSATLPRGGMAALPRALSSALPAGSLRLGTPVQSVSAGSVRLENGEQLTAGAVVVAADAAAAARLLPGVVPERPWNGCCCLYFAAERDPVGEPVLVLDGVGTGPVTNLSVPSTVNPDYAPAGASLISAAVVGIPGLADEDLEAAARAQVRAWFGSQVDDWRLLRIDRIPRALPVQATGSLSPWRRDVELADGLFACGDWLDNASIDGALASGRRAAAGVVRRLGSRAA